MGVDHRHSGLEHVHHRVGRLRRGCNTLNSPLVPVATLPVGRAGTAPVGEQERVPLRRTCRMVRRNITGVLRPLRPTPDLLHPQ
jgi:hypothetical protein